MPITTKPSRSTRKHLAAQYNKARTYAVQGFADEAFESLQKAVEFGYRDGKRLAMDSDFDAIRGDPRYLMILEKCNK